MKPSDVPEKYRDMAWEETGDSIIIDPRGVIIAGPVHGKEEIITATISLDQVRSAKSVVDIAGHYSRPDVFELKVNGELVESLAPVASDQSDEANTEQE